MSEDGLLLNVPPGAAGWGHSGPPRAGSHVPVLAAPGRQRRGALALGGYPQPALTRCPLCFPVVALRGLLAAHGLGPGATRLRGPSALLFQRPGQPRPESHLQRGAGE